MSSSKFHDDLARFGPTGSERPDLSASLAWCHKLAHGHYENFSVLTSLLPGDLRNDFAAFYAFCRTADDMADETGDTEVSHALLGWYRDQLTEAFEGTPTHPALVAMAPSIKRHEISREPMDDLITAFQEDQQRTRYETWEQLLGYCSRSANPVGRIVLRMLGEEWSDHAQVRSDALCTALQLTNHWQDLKGDLIDRDRIYIPGDMIDIPDFESRFRATARQGWSVDDTFLSDSRDLIKKCVERTWPLYAQGSELFPTLSRRSRPLVELLASGGATTLRMIETWNYETVLHRPVVGRSTRTILFLKAWISSRLARRHSRQAELVAIGEVRA